jgi:hypothetical protein
MFSGESPPVLDLDHAGDHIELVPDPGLLNVVIDDVPVPMQR